MAKTLGWHWILDATGCEPAALLDPACLERALIELPETLGLTRVGTPQLHRHVDPHDGETLAGITLLAESHLSLHARPTAGLLHVDLFSCARFDHAQARTFLEQLYGFTVATEDLIERGGRNAG
mgnify:CR=1 FL=1